MLAEKKALVSGSAATGFKTDLAGPEGGEDRESVGGPRAPMVAPRIRPRPVKLAGETYRLRTPLGIAYIVVNVDEDGEPFEVFLNVGKAGSDTAAVAEAMGRLISLILRIPSPIPATRRLKHVVRQLRGIGGRRPLGFGPRRVESLPDGVAQVLAEHLGLADYADDDALADGVGCSTSR